MYNMVAMYNDSTKVLIVTLHAKLYVALFCGQFCDVQVYKEDCINYTIVKVVTNNDQMYVFHRDTACMD